VCFDLKIRILKFLFDFLKPIDKEDWLKITSFNRHFNPSENSKQKGRNYMTDTLKLSANLVDIMMNNSIEENWPKGFKTQELREKNKEMIKQMKGDLVSSLIICYHLTK